MNNSTFGRAGEEKAAAFLKIKGYKIIAVNYSSSGGEIDIVAFKRGTLSFTEVKSRSGDGFGLPHEAVDQAKQAKIKKAADGFLREQAAENKIPVFSKLLKRNIYRRIKKRRFDIVEVYMTRNLEAEHINIIENAF